MNPARLHGRDHELLGRVAAISEGACAIAISRGGAGKTYHYKHPNEDAAAFAIGPGGYLVIVADAHGGRDASEIAVETLLREAADEWTAASAESVMNDWPNQVHAAIAAVHGEILQAVACGAVQSSRTTLVFALARPAEDRIAVGAIGDSHAFALGADGPRDFARSDDFARAFVGDPADTAQDLRDRCIATLHPIAATRVLALVTDGLSEHGIGVEHPETAIAEAAGRAVLEPPDLRPMSAARSVVEAALEAHVDNKAGDNVASAVIWLETPELESERSQ
jgi:serine/threonine protein phosphatase PrpC